MENIQEKVNRLVTCCRICSVLGLGQICIEKYGSYAIEQRRRITYQFSNFEDLEFFLEESLLRRSKRWSHAKDKQVNRRMNFLRKVSDIDAKTGSVMIKSSI